MIAEVTTENICAYIKSFQPVADRSSKADATFEFDNLYVLHPNEAFVELLSELEEQEKVI